MASCLVVVFCGHDRVILCAAGGQRLPKGSIERRRWETWTSRRAPYQDRRYP